ncbi:MAG: hypothetical protein KAI71_06020 [Candidatus Pacebacteria bacterium]|nr:hypothetical protein [Candidatus Paceibacterota bacterium]
MRMVIVAMLIIAIIMFSLGCTDNPTSSKLEKAGCAENPPGPESLFALVGIIVVAIYILKNRDDDKKKKKKNIKYEEEYR